MARIEKTVFISYRRADVYTALAVYENLKNQGYDVFFDYRSISSGDFEQIITANIKARAHFLVILTPTSLDRLNEPGDWLRREIEIAIEEKRNIVPLFFKGFRFGTPAVSGKLTGRLKYLNRYNGLNVHEDYFDEAMIRLRTQFLGKPLDTVLHPISAEVQKVVKEEKVAADEALKQIEEKKVPKAEPAPSPAVSPKMQEKSELDVLKSQAIQYELRGDLYNALQTYYKIKRLDPLFPSVDLKIKQLERELQPKPVAAASVPRSIPVQQRKSLPWKPVAVVAGALVVLALCIWGGISLWNNLSSGAPEPTRTSQPPPLQTSQPVQTPLSAGTETLVFTPVSSETPSPSLTYTVQAGDTCASIALNYGVSVDSLISLNNMDSGCFLVVGKTLKIPELTPPVIGSTMTGKDGMTLLYVPAGEFTMGSEDGEDDEKPVHTVYLDAYWIDQTEVTNAMFLEFLNSNVSQISLQGGKDVIINDNRIYVLFCDGCSDLYPAWKDRLVWSGKQFFVESGYENHPVLFVTWYGANAYCGWADRRLPTEAEWEKAARGENAFIYPWGNDTPKSNLLNYDGIVGNTTQVGSYPNGGSPYGVLDMAGNALEWVNDWYDGSYYASSPESNPPGPESGYDRVLRGGAWNIYSNVVRSAFRSYTYSPGVTFVAVGFRCAMDAE